MLLFLVLHIVDSFHVLILYDRSLDYENTGHTIIFFYFDYSAITAIILPIDSVDYIEYM